MYPNPYIQLRINEAIERAKQEDEESELWDTIEKHGHTTKRFLSLEKPEDN